MGKAMTWVLARPKLGLAHPLGLAYAKVCQRWAAVELARLVDALTTSTIIFTCLADDGHIEGGGIVLDG
jgi:hypothetical protein